MVVCLKGGTDRSPQPIVFAGSAAKIENRLEDKESGKKAKGKGQGAM